MNKESRLKRKFKFPKLSSKDYKLQVPTIKCWCKKQVLDTPTAREFLYKINQLTNQYAKNTTIVCPICRNK